jgi:hypothetical protein
MPLRFLNGHGEGFPVMSVPRVEHKRSPLSVAGKSGQGVADYTLPLASRRTTVQSIVRANPWTRLPPVLVAAA